MAKKKKSIGCPMGYGGTEPNVYGESDLSYNEYLKVLELTNLQIPQSKPGHHDELLFIIIHQVYELWFKLIIHEIETAVDHLKNKEVLQAHHFIKRIVEIMKLLVCQIHILETMRPVDFLRFRERLQPASGFQSQQFREIEFMLGLKDENYLKYFKKSPDVTKSLKKRLDEPDLHWAYFEMLKNLGYKTEGPAKIKSLCKIYQDPQDNLPLYLLSESLIELDEYLALWREHHVRVVERIIGGKRGTGGSSGIEYLRSTSHKKCFPELWEIRSHLN